MERRLPPLNALRAFEAAGRHLSFTKAADELHVTPAAISHPVKALEDYLGVQLFRRLIKVLLLTDVGQCYRRKASVKPDGYSRYFSRAPTNFRSIMLFLETCKRSIVA
jgi:hypothetical protein